MRRLGYGLVVALVCGGPAVGGCGDDEAVAPRTTAAPASTATTAPGDRQRYCEMAARFHAEADAAVPQVPTEESHAALRRFAESQLDEVDMLAVVAPSETRRDVASLVTGLRLAAAGDTTALQESRFLSASARLDRYERSECGLAAARGWLGLASAIP